LTTSIALASSDGESLGNSSGSLCLEDQTTEEFAINLAYNSIAFAGSSANDSANNNAGLLG
jgi:hypothetical protein